MTRIPVTLPLLLSQLLLHFVLAFTRAPIDFSASFRCAGHLGSEPAPSALQLVAREPLDEVATKDSQSTVPRRTWRSLGKEAAFATPVFPKERPLTIPTNVTGVKLILPDFDVLFSRIAELSPLAKQILEGRELGGFQDLDMTPDSLVWKTVEKNEKRLVHEIERIDNFEGTHTPLIRMRSRLHGPERDRGDRFSRLLTDQEFRVHWDPNCAEIYEMYLADDVNDVEMVMADNFGKCQKFGLGYCRTKKVSASAGKTNRLYFFSPLYES